MRVFNVASNRLTGVPDTLATYARSLRVLNLSKNKITSLPSELGNYLLASNDESLIFIVRSCRPVVVPSPT